MADIYRSQGYDVLMTELNAYEMMRPVKGAQVLALDLLTFLSTNESYAPIVIHGFSAGAYVWAEVMVHMLKDIKSPKYQSVLTRIQAQIWDSVVDIHEVPDAVPRALNIPEGVVYNIVKSLTQAYYQIFHDSVTVHHFRTVDVYRDTLVKAPALFIVSNADRVGTAQTSWRVKGDYESKGIPVSLLKNNWTITIKIHLQVSWKCFEDSPHIGHFKMYPEEYVSTMFNFLNPLSLFTKPISSKLKL